MSADFLDTSEFLASLRKDSKKSSLLYYKEVILDLKEKGATLKEIQKYLELHSHKASISGISKFIIKHQKTEPATDSLNASSDQLSNSNAMTSSNTLNASSEAVYQPTSSSKLGVRVKNLDKSRFEDPMKNNPLAPFKTENFNILNQG